MQLIFLLANFLKETCSRAVSSCSEVIDSNSAGEEKCSNISLDVLPKILEKTDSYSAKIWSRMQIVFLFKSPIDETR